MKKILLSLVAVVFVIGVASLTVGGSFAGFSDSETSYDNYIETGDLDLKVAKCDDNWKPGQFNDDKLWGAGLETCFDLSQGELYQSYDCNLLLWNAGCVDGMAYVHVRIVEDEEDLASNIDMDIWYDDDGNGVIDKADKADRVESARISELGCQQILLGPLPAGEVRRLMIDIHGHSGSPGDSLTFDIQFDLLGGYVEDLVFVPSSFSDSEISQGNYFEIVEE